MNDELDVAPSAADPDAMFSGGGVMGGMGFPWSSTVLGSPERWPQPLKTLVDVMLNSNQPMFIVWGVDRTLLYNDAYAEILANKHPAALGQDFLKVWHEIERDLRPLVDTVFSGQSVHMDDIALTMQRKGFAEQTHFAFSYTPVRDEDGTIAGFFCPCNEITRQVLADRRQNLQAAIDASLRDLDDIEDIVVRASRLLAEAIRAPYAAYVRVEGDQRHVVVRGEWNACDVATLTGRHDARDYGATFLAALRAGQPIMVSDTAQDARTNEAGVLERFQALGIAALINVPLVRAGKIVANALVHSKQPRVWTDVEVDLVRDMAERVWSALERVSAEAKARDTNQRYRIAALATNDAIWDWDLQSNSVLWNEALYAAYRYGPDDVEDTGDWWISRIHPDDRARVEHSIHDVIESAEEHWTEEYRFLRGDGSFADVLDRGYVARDPQGTPLRMIGAMLDLTERKLAKEALQAEEERLSFALDAGGLGAWELDLAADTLTTSSQLRENFGLKPGDSFSYADLRDAVHPDDRERQDEELRLSIAECRDYNIDVRVIWPDAQIRWINLRGRPVFDGAGDAVRIAGISIDVTHRTRASLHQRLLIDELNHRVKNTLATIQSIAMQTFRTDEQGGGAPASQRALFESRLLALSNVHDVLTRENWEGARLRDVVLEAVAAHGGGDQNAFTVQGPDWRLSPKMALSLSMALHELCTNAAKYGALTVPGGHVTIRWTIEQGGAAPCLKLAWSEHGGPPVTPPLRKGFGTRLIERQLARELRGSVELTYATEGVMCTIEAPLVETATVSPPGLAQALTANGVRDES
jgi:PAS domain S-box-containing protein